MIVVNRIDEEAYEVEVLADRKTNHRVSLDERYYRKLTGGNVLPEELIQRSFEFLMERESNEQILSDFDLSVIQTYFPGYEKEIMKSCR
jgi:hypothetical protein